MKFCTQVPRTWLHKRLVFDFHLFAQIGRWRREIQTVHKFQPLNIRYLLNLHFLQKMAHVKHAQAYKEHK